MKFIYREGRPEDENQLRNLALISYSVHRKALGEEHWNSLSANLASENLFADLLKKSQCFVCTCNDHIAGMAFLVPHGNPTEIFHADWSYIRMVGVDPEFSGFGIGRQLTLLCVDFARGAGERTIALHTSEFMDAARHIYESMGFRRMINLPRRYGKNYWIYQLDL